MPHRAVHERVSIHAPARGATYVSKSLRRKDEFQFTRPQEARQPLELLIHKPDRFQFTRPQEARLTTPIVPFMDSLFQFTRPQEARLQRLYERDARGGFNSRARKRRDTGCCSFLRPFGVSIHAPARGATQRIPTTIQCSVVSIHAPARGATRACPSQKTCKEFQFTRPQEARLYLLRVKQPAEGFNSRARKRRDCVPPLLAV